MAKRKFLEMIGILFGASALTVGGAILPHSPPSLWAIQYADGTVAFSYPLRLINSRTTRNTVGERLPTYYISFSFPVAAEEPLDKLVISLDEGRRDPTFSYRLDAFRAIAHTAEGEQELAIGNVTEDSATKSVTVQFDPPVPPGDDITVALKPVRNPRFEGVYLFGINAFPLGEQAQPTFLGYARLSFYQPSGGIWR